LSCRGPGFLRAVKSCLEISSGLGEKLGNLTLLASLHNQAFAQRPLRV